ncbi:MAG: hypothetical protein WD055_00275 [Candidatus Dependentiae bacterium]
MHGFILISWMMQFFLCILITTITFSLVTDWNKKLHTINRSFNHFLTLPIAFDVLARDAQSVDAQDINIYHHQVDINEKYKKICWKYENNSLFRIIRNYDKKEERWRQSNKSLVATQINSIVFSSITSKNSDTSLVGIEINYNQKKDMKTYKKIISLHNGRVI